jgi:hypothetical protein
MRTIFERRYRKKRPERGCLDAFVSHPDDQSLRTTHYSDPVTRPTSGSITCNITPHPSRLFVQWTQSTLSPVTRRDLLVRTVAYPLGPHLLLLWQLEMVIVLVPIVALMHVGILQPPGAGSGSEVEALYAHTVYTRGGAVGARFVFRAVILPPAAVAVDAWDSGWGWCEGLGTGATSGSRSRVGGCRFTGV